MNDICQDANTALAKTVARAAKCDSDEDSAAAAPCIICHEPLEEASAAAIDGCRHRFCLVCIRRWVQTKSSCPLCNAAVATITAADGATHVVEPRAGGGPETVALRRQLDEVRTAAAALRRRVERLDLRCELGEALGDLMRLSRPLVRGAGELRARMAGAGAEEGARMVAAFQGRHRARAEEFRGKVEELRGLDARLAGLGYEFDMQVERELMDYYYELKDDMDDIQNNAREISQLADPPGGKLGEYPTCCRTRMLCGIPPDSRLYSSSPLQSPALSGSRGYLSPLQSLSF